MGKAYNMWIIMWIVLIVIAIVVMVAASVVLIAILRRWYRRRKMDARIIRQAKALGVWNTNAGGRALELYARECGVKKLAGESDPHLRARIKEKMESNGR